MLPFPRWKKVQPNCQPEPGRMSCELLLTAAAPSIIQLSLQSKGKHCQVKAGACCLDLGWRAPYPWNLFNHFHAYYTLLITGSCDMLWAGEGGNGGDCEYPSWIRFSLSFLTELWFCLSICPEGKPLKEAPGLDPDLSKSIKVGNYEKPGSCLLKVNKEAFNSNYYWQPFQIYKGNGLSMKPREQTLSRDTDRNEIASPMMSKRQWSNPLCLVPDFLMCKYMHLLHYLKPNYP